MSWCNSEARGIITTQLYRQLCVATVGGHMRVIHGGAQYVGRSHAMAVAEAERQRAPEASEGDCIALYSV